MSSLSMPDIVKIFRLIKYPVPENLSHSQKVCRLYKQCLKLSLPAQWGSHWNLPLLSRFTHEGRATIYVRETFRQRKVETDPRLIKQFVIEAEQFAAEWTRAEPAPTGLYSRGGALYQRNEPVPHELLDPSRHVDFESLNKLESESDFYIARYKQDQHAEIEEKFKAGTGKL